MNKKAIENILASELDPAYFPDAELYNWRNAKPEVKRLITKLTKKLLTI